MAGERPLDDGLHGERTVRPDGRKASGRRHAEEALAQDAQDPEDE